MQNYKARQTALLGMLFALSMALSFWNPCLPRFWPDARHEAGAFQYCCHVRRSVFEPPFGALSCAAQGVVCVAYPRRYSRVSFAVRGRAFPGCVLPASGIAIHHHRLHFSVSGALAHNCGQLLGAAVLLSDKMAITYAPMLLIAGLIVGSCTYMISRLIFPAVKRIIPPKSKAESKITF